MTVDVLVFAGLREQVGGEVVSVEVTEGATYEELVAALAARFPKAAALLNVSRIAAGGEFVPLESIVDPRAEIAMIPPVSGG